HRSGGPFARPAAVHPPLGQTDSRFDQVDSVAAQIGLRQKEDHAIHVLADALGCGRAATNVDAVLLFSPDLFHGPDDKGRFEFIDGVAILPALPDLKYAGCRHGFALVPETGSNRRSDCSSGMEKW